MLCNQCQFDKADLIMILETSYSCSMVVIRRWFWLSFILMLLTFEVRAAAAITSPVQGQAPQAFPALNSTSPAVGDTISVNANFADADEDNEWGTTFQWQLDKINILGATGDSYTLQAGEGNGKKLRVGVTPRTNPKLTAPAVGAQVWSTEVETLGVAPVAINIAIAGNMLAGTMLTGSYQYSDADGDKENLGVSGTSYQWYRGGMGMRDERIAGATSKTYTPTLSDSGKTLRFGVTPKSLTGQPNLGKEVLSTPTGVVRSAVISNMAIKDNYAKADGVSINSVVVYVSDGNGSPLPGQVVSFSADNGAEIQSRGVTLSDGRVTMTLTSKSEGNKKVTASINSSIREVVVKFTSTAKITDMAVSSNNALANGVDKNSVTVIVKDDFGHVVANQPVNFSTPNATISSSGLTDASGVVTMVLTSKIPGTHNVYAETNDSRSSVAVSFSSTSKINDIAVISDNAFANGGFTNSVKVTIKDVFGQAVVGESISFSASNGATIANSGNTDNTGSVIMTITSKTAGKSNVTATINGDTRTVSVTFLANAFGGINVNNHIFKVSHSFPTTAFAGAFFTLVMPEPNLANKFNWKSNVAWASVDSNGKVTLSRGNSSFVTITATPKMGGEQISYQFKIDAWFFPISSSVTWDNAANSCLSQGGRVPLSTEFSMGYNSARQVGRLFNEWGDMSIYNVGFTYDIWLGTENNIKTGSPINGRVLNFTGGIGTRYRLGCVAL